MEVIKIRVTSAKNNNIRAYNAFVKDCFSILANQLRYRVASVKHMGERYMKTHRELKDVMGDVINIAKARDLGLIHQGC